MSEQPTEEQAKDWLYTNDANFANARVTLLEEALKACLSLSSSPEMTTMFEAIMDNGTANIVKQRLGTLNSDG